MSKPTGKTAPASAGAARVIDLDAARAARAEAHAEPVTLRFGGEDFTLPPEMPADFPLLAAAGDLRGSIGALLGDQIEKFFALRPSMDDIAALAAASRDIYGITAGEAPASPTS